jgi:hypothetical protein
MLEKSSCPQLLGTANEVPIPTPETITKRFQYVFEHSTHTEHTEKEPDFLVYSFRVFSVFRGSLIGSRTDRVASVVPVRII